MKCHLILTMLVIIMFNNYYYYYFKPIMNFKRVGVKNIIYIYIYTNI